MTVDVKPLVQPEAWLVIPARGKRAVFLGEERERAARYAVGVRGTLVPLGPIDETGGPKAKPE